MLLPVSGKKWKFQNFMYNIYDKLWGDDITNSLIWIFIRTGQEMFPKKCEISKCHNFLISYPIFIIFAPICGEIFTLSFEIMLILDRTSLFNKRKSFLAKRVKHHFWHFQSMDTIAKYKTVSTRNDRMPTSPPYIHVTEYFGGYDQNYIPHNVFFSFFTFQRPQSQNIPSWQKCI